MNETIDHLINYGNILLSCSIPHDMHLEHRMPAHSIIFVRSGKLVIEGRETTDEVMADNFVFVRRDCSVNVTKVPLDGHPYRGINFSLPRKELKEYYNRVAATCKRLHGLGPIGKTVNVLPRTVALKSLFDSFLPYTDSGETPADEWLRLKVHEAVMCLLAIDDRFYPTLFDFNEAWKIDLMDFMESNYTEVAARAFFRFLAIWSGQLVGLGPQVTPSIRAMASSAFMPLSRLAMPFRLPLQPPITSMDWMVWSGASSILVMREQVPWLG